MFFLIAGVQPRTTTLDDQPSRCPLCGLHQAVHQRIDHYVSLFFIPLLRVKKGEAFLFCQRCRRPVQAIDDRPSGGADDRLTCPYCGGALGSDFAYCPHCGRRR